MELIDPSNIIIGLIILNFLAFLTFGIDKARAESGQWRVQESTLLLLAFFGGSIGAYAGRALFRHKTRKQPFSNNLFAIAILQIIAIGAGAGWLLAG